MKWTRCKQPNQQRSPHGARFVRVFRPRLELLEDRIQLGDTLLGMAAIALGGLDFASGDAPQVLDPTEQDRAWQHGLLRSLDETVSLPAYDFPREPAPSATAPNSAITPGWSPPSLASAETLTGPWAGYRQAGSTLPLSQTLPVERSGSGQGMAAPWSAGVQASPVADLGIGDAGGRSWQMFAASGLASSSARFVDLSFDGSTGQLTIRGDAQPHTIREAPASDGFLDVMIDGQRHSSNPASAAFDRALAGATGARVAGIRYAGGGQDTLIVGSQSVAGGFTVQAAGASVITENVASTGPLVIQAPNITVRGAVQGSTVTLAAPGWVTVDAAGRLDAVPSSRRAGGVSPPSTIDVAAGVFVNSGQLHADGSSGGQIAIAAGNILNAGPIAADGTGISGNGGQVRIAFTGGYVATAASVVSASCAAGSGGSVTIDGGNTGRLYSSGRQLATGSVGGVVDLFSREVILSGATVDVSGEVGGGTVRLGGDVAGHNSTTVHTDTVTVTAASIIRADAVRNGNGGRVSIGASQDTLFAGTVSARGGLAGGSGGEIEVSGHGDLTYAGSADAGKGGTLLLDPKNITISDAPVGVFPQFDLLDPHPTANGSFSKDVFVLRSGNVVITNPDDDFGGTGAGAVYLFDGFSGALISALIGNHPGDRVGYYFSVTLLNNGNFVAATWYWNSNRGAATWGSGITGVSGTISEANSLVGSNPGDLVGNGSYVNYVYVPSVVPLNNGNYVVMSPRWNGYEGAVTWGDGSAGVTGTVSAANSLVGSNPNDQVGDRGVTLLTNGNYLVDSADWNGGRGAVTWGNGATGISGTVSEANSLVGSNPGDAVGGGANPPSVFLLNNGNYVIDSPRWNGNRGAVTWGSSSTGVSGIVSAINSLVGSDAGDQVGDLRIALLSNGNYVVESPHWNNNRGAATWGDGSGGVTGTVSAANSLVGSTPGDSVGGSKPLSNGNYLVVTPLWNSDRGAVTWGNGSTGVSGTVSASNSLVGSNSGDYVGYYPGATLLSNGNYVVGTPTWNRGRGAATWGSGTTGVTGTISEANSLVGINTDQVGSSIYPLSNGNYVVGSPRWNLDRGAATWGNGTTGVTGTISEANSLVGSSEADFVGGGSVLVNVRPPTGAYVGTVLPLTNGNYVVVSDYWNMERGAVTWGDGRTGVRGTISAANSLVGSAAGDQVGATSTFGAGSSANLVLSNGDYVISSPLWNGERGAATWEDGSMGASGTISEANSLVGSNPGDLVGSSLTPLKNGNYVVSSSAWHGQRGAATWGNGNMGVQGVVSEANSLIGSNPGDGFGSPNSGDLVGFGGVSPLSNGNYVVDSPFWTTNRGAVTWGNGSTGTTGILSEANSLIGSNPGDLYYPVILPLSTGNYAVVGTTGTTWVSGTSGQTLDGRNTITPQNSLVGGFRWSTEDPADASFLRIGNGRVTVGLPDPNLFSYPRGQAATVSLTPQFLTRTLDTGTAVVLQASNDITVNSPITVNAGGNGGALTLQAGRSILLNASITTDNGGLNLIANDPLANGVVDAERDPGQGVITMAAGTVLNTGSGTLTVELRDGAGLTNRDSGAITLQSATAGSVSVVNHGLSAGSDISLGTVTTTGPQSYANPNGTISVTGNLTTADSPITFNDSVAINAGLTLSVGAGTVNFAGTVAPSPGADTIAGGVVLMGSATLSITLTGTDAGSYSQLAASGPITLTDSTLSLVFGFEPPVGSSFEIVTNTGTGPINGTFHGLDEGALFSQGGYQFQISYQGGIGSNSVVLTRRA